jgi:hypothetical protein
MHTKLLIRPDTFTSRYQQWRELRRPLQLAAFKSSFEAELFGMGADDMRFEQDIHHTRLLWQPEDISKEDMSFWLDDFRNTLLSQRYFNQFSDERTEHFDSGLKMTVHRHYMKPQISFKEIITPETSHLYGNIFLEHHFNDNFNSLTIQIHYYSHKLYLSFEKLMEIMLK